MFEKILEILFPTCCGICGRIYKKWICPKCYNKLKNELKYIKIKQDDFYLYYIGEYEKNFRKILLKFKFKDSAYLGNLYIELIKKNQKFMQHLKEYNYIIPVPMYKANKNIRGYNQSELIAKKLAKEINIEYNENIIWKIRQNKKQSSLNEIDRAKNVEKVYAIQNEKILDNKKVLLVDDIYTTGNTVKACLKELKKAKVQKIDVLVIAKRSKKLT